MPIYEVLFTKIVESPVLAAALLSSFFTLFGVAITQWISTHQLNKKLRHDSDERKSDYQDNVKKEIFFAAIEALASNKHLFMNLPNTESPSGLKIDKGNIASIYKLHLVANLESIKLFKKAETFFNIKFTELSGLFFDIHTHRINSQSAQKMMDLYSTQSNNIIEEMKEFNKQKSTNQSLWDSLSQQSQETRKEFDSQMEIKNRADKAVAYGQLELLKRCVYAGEELEKIIAELILNTREELGFTLEESKEFLKLVEECSQINLKLTDKIMLETKQLLDAAVAENEEEQHS